MPGAEGSQGPAHQAGGSGVASQKNGEGPGGSQGNNLTDPPNPQVRRRQGARQYTVIPSGSSRPHSGKATSEQARGILCLELTNSEGQVVRWEVQCPLTLSSTSHVSRGMCLSLSDPQFLYL